MSGSHVHVKTPEGELEIDLPLPGLYNVYNALAAITAGLRSGVGLDTMRSGLESMTAVFGRVETIEVAGKPVSILLIKNPAGANEVLRTLQLESDGSGLDLWIALNDKIADGRDVSWVWDADFELLADHVRRVTCAGTRAPEMALRLKYAGWPQERDRGAPDPRRIVARPGRGRGRRPLFALPTYTALLELRTCWPTAASPGSTGNEPVRPNGQTASLRSGRTSSSAPTWPTIRSGRTSSSRTGARCSSWVRARAGSSIHPGARRHRGGRGRARRRAGGRARRAAPTRRPRR